MPVAKILQPQNTPRSDDLDELFYRCLTLMELTEPEDLATARSVLRIDATKHFYDNEDYYRERFNDIRHG